MDRTQFTFYESFFEALRRIKKKSDRADAYDAMCAYALYEIEPDMDKLPDAAAVAFLLVKPNLDASRRKASSGKRGGSAKQTASKPEANGKGEQTAREKENEKEKEGEIENECYSPTPLPPEKKQTRSTPTLEQVEEMAKLNRCPELAKPFFDYYAAAGWRDSEGKPVYSWQQKFQAWKLREEKRQRPQGKAQEPWSYDPGSLEGSL